MGRNASAKHISEVGNYGDGRENYASKYLLENAPSNDPAAAVKALEEFDQRWSMLHLGEEKGEHLDRAVREVLAEKKSQSEQMSDGLVRALEIGAYIGYSAMRIGKLLAEANDGSTLLSVEQNEDNATLSKIHIEHTGLEEVVSVVHAKVEEYLESFESTNAAPFDFVFIDHRKPFYLQHLKLLEAKGVIEPAKTTVVADNVASLEHVRNREASIARGKRSSPCKCVNKACNYLDYVRTYYSTEVYYGANTKDGISVSKPLIKKG